MILLTSTGQLSVHKFWSILKSFIFPCLKLKSLPVSAYYVNPSFVWVECISSTDICWWSETGLWETQFHGINQELINIYWNITASPVVIFLFIEGKEILDTFSDSACAIMRVCETTVVVQCIFIQSSSMSNTFFFKLITGTTPTSSTRHSGTHIGCRVCQK